MGTRNNRNLPRHSGIRQKRTRDRPAPSGLNLRGRVLISSLIGAAWSMSAMPQQRPNPASQRNDAMSQKETSRFPGCAQTAIANPNGNLRTRRLRLRRNVIATDAAKEAPVPQLATATAKGELKSLASPDAA